MSLNGSSGVSCTPAAQTADLDRAILAALGQRAPHTVSWTHLLYTNFVARWCARTGTPHDRAVDLLHARLRALVAAGHVCQAGRTHRYCLPAEGIPS